MAKSNIEWTNETWNIITGCSKRSEGCKNCYAERMHKRLTAMGNEKYKFPFNNIVFHYNELSRNFGDKPKMIFVNSMSDTFNECITDEQIDKILDVCRNNPQHTFQILTKRPERLPNFTYPHNVWLGVTVEMKKYRKRINYLKETNARIKFLSCEPLIEDLEKINLTGINWVIVGGESGPNARPLNPHWAGDIYRQCIEQNVPFFFKQWGEWLPFRYDFFKNSGYCTAIKNESLQGYEIVSHPFDYLKKKYKVFEWTDHTIDGKPIDISVKVGRNKAGSLLGVQEFKEYPELLSYER